MKTTKFEQDKLNVVDVPGNGKMTLESLHEKMCLDINQFIYEELGHKDTSIGLIEAYNNGGVENMIGLYVSLRRYIERMEIAALIHKILKK